LHEDTIAPIDRIVDRDALEPGKQSLKHCRGHSDGPSKRPDNFRVLACRHIDTPQYVV
jgi:hypothetical protein